MGFFKIFMSKIKNYLNRIKAGFSRNKKSSLILVFLILIGGASLTYAFSSQNRDQAQDESSGKTVSLIVLSDIDQTFNGKIETTGEVESSSQAEVKAEYSAPVASINVEIGDFVQAGQILVTLKSADLTAGVAGARAVVEREKIRLAQLEKGVRAEGKAVFEAQVGQAGGSVLNAEESVWNALNVAYSDLQQALRANIDLLYTNPTSSPSFGISISSSVGTTYYIGNSHDSLTYNLNSRRRQLNDILEDWAVELNQNSNKEVDVLVTKMISDLTLAQKLALDLSEVINDYTASDVAGQNIYTPYQNSVSTALTKINTALTNLRNANQGLSSARRSLVLAEEQLKLNTAPPTIEEINLQRNAIAQAEANLASSGAGASKTVLRAPVSGSVVTLPVRIGEYVSPGQLIALVADQNNIQIKTYISSQDIKKVDIGNKVVIDEKYQGSVFKMSSGVDPVTQKVELGLSLADNVVNDLVIGEYVAVQIETNSNGENKEITKRPEAIIYLPLKAVKLDPSGARVFVVNKNNKISSVPVTTGVVEGDQIEIISGLDGIDKIVASVRGLTEGDLVNTETNKNENLSK